MRASRGLLVAVITVAAIVSCGGDDSSETEAGPPDTGPTTVTSAPASSTVQPGAAIPSQAVPPLGEVRLKLTKVADLDQPLALALREGDDAFYVAEKGGRVRAVGGGGEVADGAVLDLSGEVSTGSEQGLLGIAFSPDGSKLYASFTNSGGDSRLWEYAFVDGRADPASKREVMAQPQPFANHNGGQVAFGPDGLLYYFLGDGGSGGDPMGNAQNLGTWLGKILRIDPRPSAGAAYTVPPDNPFVDRAGAKPEIYSLGLRNPWRASWDRDTGDLWIGDVGQNEIEEIDFSPAGTAAGANYGWNAFEGSKPFNPTTPAPENHTPPVHEYPTRQGCSVTGGYVYRGAAIPALAGTYVFGDYCSGQISGLRVSGGKKTEEGDLGINADGLSSFGQDRDGNLYVFSLSEGMFRIDPA